MSSPDAFVSGNSRYKKTAMYLKVLTLLGVGCLAYLACTTFSGKTGAVKQETNRAMTLASFIPLAKKGQVSLFEHRNFLGQQLTLNAGFQGDLGPYGFNDKISSIQIGEGLRVLFCEHPKCQGSNWDNSFELLGPYNAPNPYTANDWVSHIKVYAYDQNADPRVMLLGTGNFDYDRSGTFPAGKYSTQDIKNNHIDSPGNDGSASGIVIPPQIKVILYRGDFFQGESKELSGPMQADFKARGDLSKWNDKIGSMIVINLAKGDTPIKVNGRWKKVISSNDYISQQITVGVTIDKTKTNEKEISTSITVGMEFGSDALGYKATVSTTAGTAIRNSVSDTLSRSSSTQITASCTNQERVKITLWQWEMTGTRDGAVIMRLEDNEFICKLGESSPACPIGYCLDQQCITCKEYQR